ncbi:MAG: Si-specific NAD(P)(+) transhydrogenase, partial [Planctomycetota bacterium]
DLIVIGSGPAGQKAALQAAKLGKRVALVDKRAMIGGVCIHTGTIPSKAIREAVLHLSGIREREMYGTDYAVKHEITMEDLLHRAQHVVRCETQVIHGQMRRNGIELLFGEASFIDPHTVSIRHDDDETVLNADNILIAVGTNPARPSGVPFTPGVVVDSNELLSLTKLPKELIVVGGGVIGTEYAAMLAAAGTRVTLIEGRHRLLEFVDAELAEVLQFRLRDMGVRLKLNEKVDTIEVLGKKGRRKGDGPNVPPHVKATLESGKVLRADCLLYCIGRQGATDVLQLDKAGLAVDKRGRVTVNEHYQTDAGHIYAAGDVIGFPALAATSMEQGRRAACHMFKHLPDSGDYEGRTDLMPYGIYTIPEISMVGQSEQQLTEAQVPYEIGIARFREIARAQLMSDTNGMLKLLFHPESRRLLGVHAIGTGATEIVHIGQTVMAAGMPIDYFVETVFNYPTLAECYKVAALDGLNRVRKWDAPLMIEQPAAEKKAA